MKRTAKLRPRLLSWIFAAGGAFVGQILLNLLIPSRKGLSFDLGYACILGCLGVILGLLITTPPDAIRLRRFSSEVIILLGMLPLQYTGQHGWPMGISQCSATIVLLIVLRSKKQSPWWAVLIGWFPI